MASAMSKQDKELLDEKIARIRKSNEEILRRRQVIEEDKKFAEQQNAMVKLRPSTDDWPRERTPALRPSIREVNFDKSDDGRQLVHELSNRTSDRGQLGSRGREVTGKGCAPPPDPVSFLADPERDFGDREPQSLMRGGGKNNRDFRKEGLRRGRGSRGRGYHGHQGLPPSLNDDVWREERYRIDEARINRQKSADGKWRREWDNEKINLESQDEPASPSFTSPSGVSNRLDRWRQQPRNFDTIDSRELTTSRGYRRNAIGGRERGGRGRANNRIYSEHSPPGRGGPPSPGHLTKVGSPKYSSGSPPILPKENLNSSCGTALPISPNSNIVPSSTHRVVTNIGDSYKVVVPNVVSETVSHGKDVYRHVSRKGRFQHSNPSAERGGYRQRLSQSQSSYSEDDCPRNEQDKIYKSKHNKQHINVPEKQKCSIGKGGNKILDASPSHKPPLPPFNTTALPKTKTDTPKLSDNGDASWEDVTTSGTESVGDDSSSFNSPKKIETTNSESDFKFTYDSASNLNDPTDVFTPDDFIQLVPSHVATENYTDANNSAINSGTVKEDNLNTETGNNIQAYISIDNAKYQSESENTFKDPTDIYTPEDFIKLVPPDADNENAVSSADTLIPKTGESSECRQSIDDKVEKDSSEKFDTLQDSTYSDEITKNKHQDDNFIINSDESVSLEISKNTIITSCSIQEDIAERENNGEISSDKKETISEGKYTTDTENNSSKTKTSDVIDKSVNGKNLPKTETDFDMKQNKQETSNDNVCNVIVEPQIESSENLTVDKD